MQDEIITEPAEPIVEDDLVVNDEDAINDEMRAAFNAAHSEGDSPVAEGQGRDESGRFVAAGDHEPTKGEGPDGNQEAEQGEPAAISDAPAHLPQALKAEWQNMPETARNEVSRLTQDWDRKFGELGAQLQQVRPVSDRLNTVLEQNPELFQGMTPEDMAQSAAELAAVQARLNTNPLDTVLEIAQHYGVLQPLASKLSGKEIEAGQGDSQALRQQIQTLEKRLQMVSPEHIEQQVSQMLEQRQTDQVVENFSTEKEFFGDVEHVLPEFIKVVQSINPNASPADVLESAYSMATQAIPEVREKAQAAEAAKATEAQAKPKLVADAKRAKSINVKPTAGTGKTDLSEDEELRLAYRQAVAG